MSLRVMRSTALSLAADGYLLVLHGETSSMGQAQFQNGKDLRRKPARCSA
jgi:hypothetical protein